ncbi:DUF4238 domain-containing protein [Cohnella abietis]|uniref:DUF4238 domain-containing protein n=1 Tax=Cohnella abietis TaxID=2507935 RepID=A0A3T1DCP5_9BACL|nr:DUF4238 domain-containing protein [Cohnella abietis]BBI35872.1 hypothetical protein KCTCHS21_52710 [Cohnella abietis]
MAEKNRQHYVPKFYLKNFSNTPKAIDTFNLTNAKYIQNASIKDMCQRHNFYGADKRIENLLNEKIETKACSLIREVLETSKFPQSIQDYMHLYMFLLVSEARNLKIAESANQAMDMLSKAILEHYPEIQDLDLNKFTIKLNEPSTYSIEAAIEGTPLVLDLKPLLIVEQTMGARRFITSDNPLIRYNSFYLSKNYPGGFGYINRGAQFFFPISPHMCILLYDEKAYDIPDQQDHILILKKGKDVDQLNELFYLNAHNNVFFEQKTKMEYIERLHHKNRREPRIANLERETNTFRAEDSQGGKLLHFSHNRVRKKFHFSWMKISNYANELIIPAHMGGINRTESPFIREFLEKRKLEFEQERPPSSNKFFRT